ncbi:glutamate NMDA receptor-associated protein 1-like [Nesidiocoris tenuis]|uniref:Glutamate NMDA receptor-associated protein 1-like n=1 Tax=Nesidiocoris tenuis TaxID=355587 RepID=A0ABN7BFT2_9HEMI|nr:glutamate NMDA receptor-associated protein 1-like [Nesidiocoris tenuis]
MAWQGPGGYPGQGQPPPPGFYPDPSLGGGYPAGGAPYPGGGGPPYPGAGPYPQQGFPGAAPYPQQAGGGGFFPGSAPYVPKPPGYDMGGGNYNSTGYGEDGNGMQNFDFSDKSIRLGFIRKVYGILFVQLTVTLGFIAMFTFHDGTKMFVARNPFLWWVSLGVMFVCLITMSCCGDVRRKAPMNMVFLGLFTVAESFLLGCATINFRANEVLLAVGICAIVTLGLTIFAFQTKIDFTMMGGVLFVATLILMIFGIVLMFWNGKVATLIYASFGALLFSIYIIYDTQIMIGGSHKFSISPEEYIFAALNLYLDIVNLFLYILTILGATRD